MGAGDGDTTALSSVGTLRSLIVAAWLPTLVPRDGHAIHYRATSSQQALQRLRMRQGRERVGQTPIQRDWLLIPPPMYGMMVVQDRY